mmetsp:Transcript_11407/g.21362  ORF Transcript_11407/g.21362 Transcript_11407/m.21362 type:complete len:218 (-) Transcript_11407:52-705(-)
MVSTAPLPESFLQQLRESETDDDATLEFIRSGVDSVLSGSDSREDRVTELAEMLEAYGAESQAEVLLEWAAGVVAKEAETDRAPTKDKMKLVQQLVAADAEQLEQQALAQREAAAKASALAPDDSEKAAVREALRQYGKADCNAAEMDDALSSRNDNKHASAEYLAERRRQAQQEAAVKAAKMKEMQAADKARRAEAKKKGNERSKANESRRGGRSM